MPGPDSKKKVTLGIDIGSVAMSIALLNTNNQITHTSYTFHRGQIEKHLFELLSEIHINDVESIGFTSSGVSYINQGISVDSRIAYISAAKFLHPKLQSLLIIGAEKFGLVKFDVHGEYLNYYSNSSCAAGTGNFLDQQVDRLNLEDIVEFSKIAHENQGNYPAIASRCAVFAKTDMIHAQQEGYSLAAICDGLSRGLAKNIVDAVFKNQILEHVIAAGGVALNKAVISHIREILNIDITVDRYAPFYGSIGAALSACEEKKASIVQLRSIQDLKINNNKNEKTRYPPLRIALTNYPDFEAHCTYQFNSKCFPAMKAVEVDIYFAIPGGTSVEVYLGIDIGSTSTKAVLLSPEKRVLIGLYTRTSGQPLKAVQVIFETIDDISRRHALHFDVIGTATTGSGRKFTGNIIGADIVLNEITAHARAAYELDPDTDTIIEIGGQDSKFTIMRNGMVTSSIMNNVCAAGTGSFIEEQAKRLGCSLSDYTTRIENVSAPMLSDRCTVFMERDQNHYLMEGYSKDEMLAAVLHATRENYLAKVAIKGFIGQKICFQGATAKNKALVAAFEQTLNKSIMVSRYCHLTGAIGVALTLYDQQIHTTKFRGLKLYKESIPIRTEVCDLCTNHCKLKIAEIDDAVETYGFLCGRDYEDNKYVREKSAGFNLIRARNELFKFKATTRKPVLTIGIPAGLYLFEEILFWRLFFDFLSIKTVTSEKYLQVIKDGKNLNNAEFCAPIAAMHGHVNYLNNKVDFIFLPVYLEARDDKNTKKQYCYYSQFVSSVIFSHDHLNSRKKLLSPLLNYTKGTSHIESKLYDMLSIIELKKIRRAEVCRAYEKASKQLLSIKEGWRALYQKHEDDKNNIHVMLLGRPYTVLSPAMNNNIPDIFQKMGIKTFFMDMLPDHPDEPSEVSESIISMEWKYATRILKVAKKVAKSDHCYPVLITSFKCSPDTFVIEYFKEVFDAAEKPYLILQLDEHDSRVGYETRIEAATNSFRNHHDRIRFLHQKPVTQTKEINKQHSDNDLSDEKNHKFVFNSLINQAKQILRANNIDTKLVSNLVKLKPPSYHHKQSLPIIGDAMLLQNKTLLLPNWDLYSGPLLEAMLQNQGINARLVQTSAASIHCSLTTNTGQCLPLNIIVQDAIDYIETHGLNPSDTALWIMKSDLSCNLSMFPYFMKKLLDNHGRGMEHVSVYKGDLSFFDFSLSTSINAYLAHMFGGYIRKIACSIRPYEIHKGVTDKTIEKARNLFYDYFRNGKEKDLALKEVVHEFELISIEKSHKPKVAIFGDLYVRDNNLMNQDLIKMIESNGGEVITTPYSEFIKIVIDTTTKRFYKRRRYADYLKMKFLKSLIPLVEEKYKKYLFKFDIEAKKMSFDEIDSWLDKFGMNMMYRGESLENLLKIYVLMKQHPDIDLFIQTNPSYCCPSLVTEAMSSRIEELTGVPVVTIEYDGTSEFKNGKIIPYLKYRRKRKTLM
jgi:predicted CoA-substrate-specific enzyme activase